LDLSIINIQLKEKIENRISYPKQNFEDIRKSIIQIFAKENNSIPLEMINSLNNQLENINHIVDHFLYLERKICVDIQS
jgi:hypothetical protein